MKTILKTIQNIGLAVIACLIIPNVLLSQNLNIPLNVDGTTNATIDSYTIGGSYNYTLTPQTIEGDVTWEVVNIDDLEDAGLQMEINSTVFEALNSPFLVSPDGTAEILHFSVNAAANPIINETGHVIQLSVSDNDNTVNLNLTIPVIRQPVSVAFVFDRSGSMGSP